MAQGMEFGFVPSQVIRDLRDIGNWKVMPCIHPAVLSIPHIGLWRCLCWQLTDISVRLLHLTALSAFGRAIACPGHFVLVCKDTCRYKALSLPPISLAAAGSLSWYATFWPVNKPFTLMLQVRALAIDALQAAVGSVSDKLQLLPTLSKFIQFLMLLLADPNFKISLSTMQILGDLITKVGYDIKPYLG